MTIYCTACALSLALSRREEIIDVIKRCFFAIKGKNLAIFHVDKKDLRDFTTTEKDMNKHQSKFPTSNYRVTQGEDLFNVGAGAATQSMVQDTSDDGVFSGSSTGESDLQAQQAARGKQLTNLDSFDSSDTMSDADSIDVRQSMVGGAAAVFARSENT